MIETDACSPGSEGALDDLVDVLIERLGQAHM